MPSWSIHLKIGKEILKKHEPNKDLFLFGSLLPDSDYGWSKGRFECHYYGKLKFPKCPKENMIDLDGFLEDYKDKLHNDLILGVYCHLLTDFYFNEYTYYNKWVLDEDDNIIGVYTKDGNIIKIKECMREAMKYKHRDFELYGKYLFNNEKLLLPKNIDCIIDNKDLLKDNYISVDNIVKRINYLNEDFIEFNSFKDNESIEDLTIFTKDELDTLVRNCTKHLEDVLFNNKD